jgi:hypothetical protein
MKIVLNPETEKRIRQAVKFGDPMAARGKWATKLLIG